MPPRAPLSWPGSDWTARWPKPSATPPTLRGSRSRAALLRRKRRDAAVALTLAGAFLLVSPFLDLFADAGRIWGVPAATVYVFGVRSALIALTAALARGLADDGGE